MAFDSDTLLAMQPITTTSELADACRRMAAHPFVTVDTEFLRETTYYPLLCVAQLASPDEGLVLDALAPGIDLAPFYELMANEKVMKVFHAARQDVETARTAVSIPPLRLYDRLAVRTMPAVVPIRGGKCGGCHLKVSSDADSASRSQKANAELVTCDQCGRIIYWEN